MSLRLGVAVLFSVYVLLSLSCGPERFKVKLDDEDRYQLAVQYLEKGNYDRAIAEFKALILNFPGSALVDDAEFGLAEAYFRSKDYNLALAEYKRLLRDFPQSEYADDAQYKIGLCYFRLSLPAELDQEYTYKAIEGFRRFLEYYPDSELAGEAKKKIFACREKLARKTYKNGCLYLKLKEYEAALIYFQDVLNEYEDTKWAAWAQLGIGEVYYRQGKYESALEAFLEVMVNYGDHQKVSTKARKRMKTIRRKPREKDQAGWKWLHGGQDGWG